MATTNINAKVTGTIAIQGVDRKYLKFVVKSQDGGKVSFVGNKGKYVNMYYINDVKCEGPTGGLSVGIIYLSDGFVNFTISGYQGQDGRIAFLSSQAGDVSYNGSLAVKDYPDFTCQFSIQNL
ncbi:hypothetical protein JAAARDRAFT_199457 [Jaapia argillacea MUCL 33604]|uniref:Uncharacterized protein n=1 Tax=Jaapia argillacea MUCL 33604 TaxID=933084 RepID=A0A067PB68_9AGAM|nr:hypothetical protein JAAARDRAFT_199457 [Jaapia argillacea MUCL 33604]